MTLLFFTALSAAALAAPCEQPISPEALDLTLDAALAAWTDVDEPAFLARVEELRAGVPCLAAPLTAAQASELHRVLGIAEVGASALDAAALSFAASRAAAEGATLPVPDRHPLLAVFTSVDLSAAEANALPPPPEGQLLIDGSPATARVEAWPAVVQWVVDGELRRSELLAPGRPPAPWPAPVPALVEAAPALVEAPAPESPRGNPARNLPVARIAAAGGAAALAGGLWIGSAVQAQRFEAASASLSDDPQGSIEALAASRRGANALGATAACSAAAAAGLGLSLVFTF